MRKFIRENLISIVMIIAILQSVISIGVCAFWACDFEGKGILNVILMIICILSMVLMWFVLFFMVKDEEYQRIKDDSRYVKKK